MVVETAAESQSLLAHLGLTPAPEEEEQLDRTVHDSKLQEQIIKEAQEERRKVDQRGVPGIRTENFGGVATKGTPPAAGDEGVALVGKRLGKYKLEALIGSGASSNVYRSMHPKLNFPVAIKVLSEHAERTNQARIEDFFLEARISVQINHPHSVRIFDLDEADGRHFIVMEYVEGATTREHLDRDGPFEEGRVIELAMAMTRVLETAYEQRIIHRDIKPQNIIVTKSGSFKLSDLGLAKIANIEGTAERNIVGTPLYIAPEAIQDPGRIDYRADIYSLGATLYHLATGVPPFEGETMHELFQAHLSHYLPDPRTRRRDMSPGLAFLLMHMMEKRPDKRPVGYGALREAIEALIQERDTGRRKGMATGIVERIRGIIRR